MNVDPKFVDYIVEAIKIIDEVHHEIHEGHAFEFSYKVPEGAPIDDNANVDVIIKTGARYIHMTMFGDVGGESEVGFYKDATYTGGSQGNIFNMNHTEDEFITSVQILLGATVTDVGQKRFEGMIPGGTKTFASGGGSSTRNEWVLKPNTTYLARMTNRAGSSIYMSMQANWYEEERNNA